MADPKSGAPSPERHRYEEKRREPDPGQGRDYGRVRSEDNVAGGGENHAFGGYGSDYVRAREDFGGGGPPEHEPRDAYQPGYEVKKGSGYGALGQGGDIERPGKGMPDPDPAQEPIETGRSGAYPDRPDPKKS
ncbi:hypothetical protein [Alsobacter sp. SYSU BS001988]|jgi:hypothetical protein